MSRVPAAGADPARSWVAHLRGGGTTPWADWLREPPPATDSGSGGWSGPLPGAAQLEVVRRLAETRDSRLPDAAFTALADRALHRSGPGRGQPHLPLRVPGATDDLGVGAPPTDPGDLPVDELVRVAVGLLADLVVDAGPVPDVGPPRRRLLARSRFHLAGAPVTVDGARAALAAAGHVEGGRAPEVLLLAQPLDVHLAEVWSARVQHGAPVRWDTFAGRWARRETLPPSADLPGIAAFWAAHVGPARVHVLVAPSIHDVAAVLGLRHVPAPAGAPAVLPLAPESTDVLRRLNRVLNVRTDDDVRAGLLRRARALLPARPARPLALPEARRAWAERRAGEVAAALRAGGYPVHGDLDGIAPRHLGDAAPRRADVLTSVLETCLLLAAGGGAGGVGGSQGEKGTVT